MSGNNSKTRNPILILKKRPGIFALKLLLAVVSLVVLFKFFGSLVWEPLFIEEDADWLKISFTIALFLLPNGIAWMYIFDKVKVD